MPTTVGTPGPGGAFTRHMDEQDRHSLSLARWIFVIALALVGIVLVSASGCAHRPPKTGTLVTKPPDVKVVVKLRPPVECLLVYVPAPPEPSWLNAGEEDDVMKRVMVHRRDYDTLLTWAKGQHEAYNALTACVEEMRERLSSIEETQ